MTPRSLSRYNGRGGTARRPNKALAGGGEGIEMTLQEKLRDDLKNALRKGDKTRVSVIRMALSAVNYAEIGQQRKLDDPGVLDVLAREAKQRRESIAEFGKGNRPDLVAKEEAELAIVLEYLPRQMSREEVAALARQVAQEVGAKSPAEKGKLMSRLMPQLKGKADGKLVNEVVTEILTGAG